MLSAICDDRRDTLYPRDRGRDSHICRGRGAEEILCQETAKKALEGRSGGRVQEGLLRETRAKVRGTGLPHALDLPPD